MKQHVPYYVDLDKLVAEAAKAAKLSGSKEQDAIDYVKWHAKPNADQTKKLCKQIKLIFNKQLAGIPTQAKVQFLLFKLCPSLRFNLVTGRVEISGRAITDADLNSIFLKVNSQVQTTQKLVNTILLSHWVPSFNPFDDFFKEIKSIPRSSSAGSVETLINSIVTDTPNAALFIRKWLVSIIASMDGKHSPLILVLCGRQGTGKTEFFRRLLPDKLSEYFADDCLDRGKDSEILMTEKLIILDDEFSGKSKMESKNLKQLLSKQSFSLRKPYGMVNQELSRLAVLCGTTNEAQILNDPTGNRRVLPINVLSIDHAKYNAVDKVLLFKELYEDYLAGYSPELTRQEIELLNTSTADFEIHNLEVELINKYFSIPDQSSVGTILELTPTDMMLYLKEKTGIILRNQKIGSALRKLGYHQQFKRKEDGNPQRLYQVIKKSLIINN